RASRAFGSARGLRPSSLGNASQTLRVCVGASASRALRSRQSFMTALLAGAVSGHEREAMEPIVYPLHKGAVSALTAAGVLLILLIVTAPFGIWIIYRARNGSVVLGETSIVARAIGTVRIDLTQVDRIGIAKIPVVRGGGVGGGIGAALARKKVG